jgi:hypothetical protein
VISFSVEALYSDFGGSQMARTRLRIEGRGSAWRVTDVDLYEGDADEPLVSLHREARVITGPSAEQASVEDA